MLLLDLPEHAEIVLVNLLDLDLLVILIRLFKILELDVRHVMLLKINSYYVL